MNIDRIGYPIARAIRARYARADYMLISRFPMVFAARIDFNAPRRVSFLDACYTNDSPFVKFIYVWSENPTTNLARAPLFAFNEPSVIMFRLVIKSGDFGV